tara:strand:+ start:14517 stop:15443 length:927 start_codon:yes stop_codon:yes gene_type:complete
MKIRKNIKRKNKSKTRKILKYKKRRKTQKGGGMKEIINGAENIIQKFFASITSGFTFIFDGATPEDIKNSLEQSVKQAKTKLDNKIAQDGGNKKTRKNKTKKNKTKKNKTKKNKINPKIKKAITFIKNINGFPYVNYNKKTPPKKDGGPFWLSNDKVPSLSQIKKEGVVCVGIANLCRRTMGLDIPGKITNYKTKSKLAESWPGGTAAWFDYLLNTNRLQKIDLKKSYPIGTLLLQDFNTKNQGHLAIVVSEKGDNVMNSHVIHAIRHNTDVSKSKRVDEAILHSLNKYWYHERFTHICLPENWLLKN